VLTAALRRTRAEKSATETLRDELTHLRSDSRNQARVAIVEGLREAQQHSYQQTIRRQVQRQAILSPAPAQIPEPTLTYRGPEL
jgi:hypothetical protein